MAKWTAHLMGKSWIRNTTWATIVKAPGNMLHLSALASVPEFGVGSRQLETGGALGRSYRYIWVTPDGELSIRVGKRRDILDRLKDGTGIETGVQHLDGLYPVAAYYRGLPWEGPDKRRMNKVANGMFWELSKPPGRTDPDEPTPETQESDRIVKLRGPVAFATTKGLTEEQEETLRTAHTAAVRRLKSRGWL